MRADETPWYMLKKPQQWMWSVSRSEAAYYRIDPSRGHPVVVELLQGFSGVLVVDGYAAYGPAARALEARCVWRPAGRTLDGHCSKRR